MFPNACDCHVHIYGVGHPVAPTVTAPPPNAPLSDYLTVRNAMGTDRVVLVQPTAYSTNDSCLVKAMIELGDRARGVAVVDTGVSDTELDRPTRTGTRGIRFQMLPGGTVPCEILEEMAACVVAFGWHVQLQMDARRLPERVEVLSRLPGRLVIDHTRKLLEPVLIDDPSFRCLLRLLESGKVWVKLSAPCETSKFCPPHYDDVSRLPRALVQAAPERMAWTSNWPHLGITPGRAQIAAVDGRLGA